MSVTLSAAKEACLRAWLFAAFRMTMANND